MGVTYAIIVERGVDPPLYDALRIRSQSVVSVGLEAPPQGYSARDGRGAVTGRERVYNHARERDSTRCVAKQPQSTMPQLSSARRQHVNKS